MHLGLALEDVDPRGEDRPVLERVGQRLLVDHRAAGGVHQHRGPLHQPESTSVDEAARLVGERHVQRHDVGRAAAGRRGRRTHPVIAGVGAGVVQHLHAEPRGPSGDGPTDAPVPDDPEGGAVHVDAQVVADAEAVSSGRRAGRLRRRSRAGRAARIRRNARSAVVSSSTPGVLHTAMPSSRRGRDVDVVVAHRDVGDDPQPRRAGFAARRASMRSVRMQTIASTSAAERDQLVGGVGLVAVVAARARARRRRAGRARPREAGG